jgi:Amt family ammonium transporter
MSIVILLLMPIAAVASEGALVDVQQNLTIIWVLIAAFMVFLMQAGFTMLETGFVRAKNSVNIAMKNVVDFMAGAIVFWLLGFGLMFGASQGGLFGVQGFMLSGFESSFDHAFFVFQLMFAATAATIVSGCVSERMSFRGYALISVAITVLIYPVFGHWVWHDAGWLSQLGFYDFAGSTVVHLIGGVVGLVGTMMLGARHGRFDATGQAVEIPNFNLTLVTLGVFLLWFGWFGFNGGSTLVADGTVAVVIMNTILGAAAGGVGAFLISIWRTKLVSVGRTLNGVLGGLVAITASADLITPGGALLLGFGGGAVVYYGEMLLVRLRIDDPVGAIPVHGMSGAFGTIAFVLFVSPQVLPTGSLWMQLGVQFLGVLVALFWAGALAMVAFGLIKRFGTLRVPLEHEILGLNVAEHGVRMSWLDTVQTIETIVHQGDYSRRVAVEQGTEAGDVAASFNTLLDDLEGKIAVLEQVSHGELEIETPAPKSGHDRLSLSIDQMVHNLRNLIGSIEEKNRELTELNENLEGRVADRTAELAQKNQTLEGLLEEIKATQDQLIESEKMAALGGLVAGVSHEINTPVGIAITAASHLDMEQQKIGSLLASNQMKRSDLSSFLDTTAESCKMLLHNLHRAADLVQSFKRVAVDQSTDEVQAIAAKAYIEETLTSLRPQFRNRPIEVAIACAEDLQLVVPTGPFSQVLTNLFMNALTHAFDEEQGGQIALSVRQEGDRVVIVFSDNGKGISATHLSRIFEPFFTTRRGQGGTGLGLHILYNIVTVQMGGKIEVESQEGMGTTFYITLPRAA